MRPSPVVELDAPDHDPEAPGAIEEDRPRHPHDPRRLPGYRARGPRRYPRARPGWSMPLVAAAAGVTVHAVKRAVARGRLDLNDLRSVALWIAERVQRRGNRKARGR